MVTSLPHLALIGQSLSYLDNFLPGRGGAGADVCRLSLLGMLQQIFSGRRPSWRTIGPGPLQSPIELPGQTQAELRLCVQLLVARASAHRLTLSAETCFRPEILKGLGLELRRRVRRSTGKRNQEKLLFICKNVFFGPDYSGINISVRCCMCLDLVTGVRGALEASESSLFPGKRGWTGGYAGRFQGEEWGRCAAPQKSGFVLGQSPGGRASWRRRRGSGFLSNCRRLEGR